MGDVITGLVLGALPVAILLYESSVLICDTYSSAQNFGDDLKDLVSDFGIEKQIFSNWGKGCGLAELATHSRGWSKKEYETLLVALTRIYSYLAKAQMIVNQFVNPNRNVRSPVLHKEDIRCFIPHMLEAGLEGLSSDIQGTLDELQTSAAEINSQKPAYKRIYSDLRQAKELQELIGKIRQLNISLKKLWAPIGEMIRVTSEFKIPVKHPFQKNSHFCGRTEILDKMRDVFGATAGSMGRKTITLFGIGGVGKSQICAEYAHRYERNYTSVFWITASTFDEVERTALVAVEQIIDHYITNASNQNPIGYERVALALGFSESSIDSTEKLRAAVERRSAIEVLKYWLSKGSNDGWLLVIDDYSITDPAHSLHEILPTKDVGHVLVTSQNPSPTDESTIRVPEAIGEKEGVKLLKSLAGKPDGAGYASEIVNILGGFPLALRLAGAYVFKYSFHRCVQNLRVGSGFIFKEGELKGNSLEKIWGVLLPKLGGNAVKLLRLLSFLGNNIPLELLTRAEVRIMKYCETSEEMAIDDALADLKSFSLITEKYDSKEFGIHDLVNLWAQFQLGEDECQYIAEHAVSVVTSSLAPPSGTRNPKEWVYERKIMSQIDRCYNIFWKRLSAKDAVDDRARSVARILAKVYERHSNVEKPEALYRRILEDVEEGSETIEELRLMNCLGENLTFQNKDETKREALEWHERAYKGMGKLKLPGNNADVLETKRYRADYFAKNNRLPEAIVEYKEILRVQQDEFGGDAPQTLKTRYSLAKALRVRGQIDEAFEHLVKVQAARKADPELGEHHPDTLEATYMIADIRDHRGEYGRALEEYERVLQIQVEGLGETHCSTIETIYSIADFYRRKGQYSEALGHFRMARAGFEVIFGANNTHNYTLVVDKGIAEVLELQGQFCEALRQFERLYVAYKRKSDDGKVSIWELLTANDMGRVLNRMGHYKTALQKLEEVAKEVEKKEEDGELHNHHLRPACILGIGTIHENQGQYDKALDCYMWAKERYREMRGEGHTTTLGAVCTIAKVMNKQGKYAEALEYYETAEAGQKKAFGETHPSTLQAILGKAEVYQNMGQVDRSLPLYQTVVSALEAREQDRLQTNMVVGIPRGEYSAHPMMLTAIYGMGRVSESRRAYDEASRFYDRARRGWGSSLGEHHTLTLTAELSGGRVLQKQRNYEEAWIIYDRIWREMTRDDHDVREKQPLRDQHPLRYETACCKGSWLFEKRQYDEAKASYEEALRGLQQILGDDHPTTLTAMYGKANVLRKEKNYSDALGLYQTVAAGLGAKLGSQHPETILSRKKMSSVRRRMNINRWLCFSS